MVLPDVTQSAFTIKSTDLELSPSCFPALQSAEMKHQDECAAHKLLFLQLKCGVHAQPEVKHCF